MREEIWTPTSQEQLTKWKALLDGTDHPAPGESQPSLEYILCRAIESEAYGLVKTCISHGAKLNGWVHTAVYDAMSMELFEILLPAGLDVNYNVDRVGGYLPACVRHSRMELTKYLLEKGADPNHNPLGDLYPALNLAVKGNNTGMANLLIQCGARVNGMGALGMAAQFRQFDTMRLLLKHGADVDDDARDRYDHDGIVGFTALHQAAYAGHVDVVAFLLEQGARPDLKDEFDQTPLMVAGEKGHQEVVDYLNKVEA